VLRTNGGFLARFSRDIVLPMQLIQIGQPAALTIQQLIEQMADQQVAEIEQLRQAAIARQATATLRRKAIKPPAARRLNCSRVERKTA
jgi:hypothetical protein